MQFRGEIESAQCFFEQSLGLLLALTGGKLDNSEMCTDGMVLLALLYRELGKFKISSDLLDKALHEYNAIHHGKKNKSTVSTMRELGKTLSMNRQFAASLKILNEALSIAQGLDDTVEQSKIKNEIGIYYRETNDLEKARTEFESVLQMRVSAVGECKHKR